MTQPAYPAARAAALRVHPHYARHHDGTSVEGETNALLPDLETVEAIIDVAFWSSLRREEIYTPKISLAFVAPTQVNGPLVFERPVPLASQPLTRLGPAVERPGIHLGVWRQANELQVWGTTRQLPQGCFVVEVVAPGLLVLKRSRGDDSSKFINVAVMQGDEVKVIGQTASTGAEWPEIIASLLGLRTDRASLDRINVTIQLAVSMRAHARGGLLLVVPAGSETWQESVLQPVAYSIAPPFSALVELMRADPDERLHRRWQEALRWTVEGIAGLTAVDGATIITNTYEVLAFGAKVVRRPKWGHVASVTVTEPVEGTVAAIAEPGELGGTRHLAAAQFAHDQRDAIALVASQDGRFTVFGWSSSHNVVYANRIETLLL